MTGVQTCALPISDYVVFFTDGYGSFGDDPGLPVLWVMTTDVEPPFGETIRVNVPFEGD